MMTANIQFLIFALFTTTVLATFSPTTQPSAIPPTASPTQPRFYFGQSGDLGPNATGTKLREGTLAAFREINDKGGVFGVLLDMISYDDNGYPNVTIINTQSFIDQKVVACLNYVGLDGIEHSLPMLEAAGIPMLTPVTGARALRVPVSRNMLHTRASLDEEAHSWVAYCLSRAMLSFSIFYQDDYDGQAGKDALTDALAAQGLRPISVARYVPGDTVTISGLLDPYNANLTIVPQVIIVLAAPDTALAFIKLAKAQWPAALIYLTYKFGQHAFVDKLIADGVGQALANDIFITAVLPPPVDVGLLPPVPSNWQAAHSSLLRNYATALNVTCPGCPLSYARLEGYLNGAVVVSILTHMLSFNYTSVLFRPYLDRAGVNASSFAVDDDATLRAWRELLIDTIYRESMFDVAGLKLGPYFENITCNTNDLDCVQIGGVPCNQGMSHIYLLQPVVTNRSYVELPQWRSQSPSCNYYSLPLPVEKPLVFGQSGTLMGAAGGLSTDLRNGVLAAFAEANESPSHGVRGRKLLLMSLDDNYTAIQATANAHHFINNQSMVAVVGAHGDDPTQAVIPLYAAASLPLIGTSSGARFIRGSWIIAVRPFYDDEVAAMVDFALSRQAQKVAIFRQLAAFGNAGYDGLNMALEYRKMKLHSDAGYILKTNPDWPAVFTNITRGGVPDVVMVFVYIVHAVTFIQKCFNDSAWANTTFILASTSDLDRTQRMLGPQILSSGRVFGSTVMNPARSGTFFLEYTSALRRLDPRLFQYGPPYAPTLSSLEGYMIGRLVIAGLARVTEFTGAAMLADITDKQAINVSSYRLGPYTDQCNMGLRQTYIVRLDNSTTSPLTLQGTYRTQSSNTFIPDCGTLSVYNTSFTCPRGYDKQWVNSTSYDSVCNLCLSPYGCTLPDHVPNRALRSAMLALNIIGFLIAVVFAAIVVKYHYTTTIRAVSPPFCLLILIGAMLGYVFVFIQYPVMPTAASCMGQVYVLNTASCLLFASLFAKVFRVTRLFQPRDTNAFRVLAIPNTALFTGVGVMWCIEMVYTIIWHAVNPLVPVQVSSPSSKYWVCQSEEPIWGIVDVLANALYLLYGVVLSIQSRRVPTLFNEAKFVAATMYNTLILGAIAILLGYQVAANDDQLYLFKGVGAFIVFTVDIALLIASKFPSLYAEVVNGVVPQYKKDSSSNTASVKEPTTGTTRKSEPQSKEARAAETSRSSDAPNSRGEAGREPASSHAESPPSSPQPQARNLGSTGSPPSSPQPQPRSLGSTGARIEAETACLRPVSKVEMEVTPRAVAISIEPPAPKPENGV